MILKAIQGYNIELLQRPVQANIARELSFQKLEKDKMNFEIEKMMKLGVIEHAKHEHGEFISNIFSRPKKDGSVRVILNLTKLNEFVEYNKFKMDTLKTIVRMVKPNCFMATIDLKLAYYLVPICSEDKKLLRFIWNDKLLQYTVLPNGLSSAPRLFTKIMKPVLASLRQEGHLVSCYIDDIFILGDSYEDCLFSLEQTAKLLSNLGFVINNEKSMTIPASKVNVLGFYIDSVSMRVTLTEDKIDNVSDLCYNLLNSKVITIRFLAQVIGKIVSCFPAVRFGPLFFRNLEYEKVKGLKKRGGSYDGTITVTGNMTRLMRWWIHNLPYTFNDIVIGNPRLIIETDASFKGWGASCEGNSTGGAFIEKEILDMENINVLELKAIYFGIRAFQDKVIRAKHILVKTDNTTAVAYIRNMGGTKVGCNRIAQDIWKWCKSYGVWITATYIPGKENIIADAESRNINDRTEWMLDSRVFKFINKIWGPVDIDLFASRTNCQIPVYAAWKPDPFAIAIDAFTIDWGEYSFFAFPPFSMISSCLQKVEQDRASGIMICPVWPTQAWFPVIMTMLVEEPILLRKKSDLLKLPHKAELVHPLYPKMRMMGCKISGTHSQRRAFQQASSVYSWSHGDREHRSNTLHRSRDGLDFVIKGRLIRLHQT